MIAKVGERVRLTDFRGRPVGVVEAVSLRTDAARIVWDKPSQLPDTWYGMWRLEPAGKEVQRAE